LTEALVSTAITAFGVLSVAVLFLYGTRLQTVSRDGSSGMSLATAQLERLRVLPINATERALGPHSSINGNFNVQWTVASGPATTIDVTVLVTPIRGLARPARLEALLWR